MAQFFQEILSDIKSMTVDIVPSVIQYDQGTEGRGNFQQVVEDHNEGTSLRELYKESNFSWSGNEQDETSC